ncbi:MAG TPA: GNAT family N-acetyltransferase [Xanthobacteraceae bacterium]|nr:GNAT family N-acetyltransferase [Xanthobacteraceae bacterium]
MPTLETARLLLRPPIAEDFDAWADFCADEEVSRYLGGALDRASAWRNMCTMTGAWAVRGFSVFSVIEKSSGRWIGRVGPWQPEGWPGTEVAYSLARKAWGKGYAREATSAAVDWAFKHLAWREVIHCIHPKNERSQQVATRLGSRILRQARLPPPLDVEVDIWGQTRSEWLARNPD